MAMQFSRLTFDSSAPLAGVGIDAEHPSRFSTALNGESPFPFVFSNNEISIARSSADPAQHLCSAFCCKEAFFKAVGTPFNFNEVEIERTETGCWIPLRISQSILHECTISKAFGWIEIAGSDEIVAIVITLSDHE